MRRWDTSGRCSERLDCVCETSGADAAGGEDGTPYDGRNIFCESPHPNPLPVGEGKKRKIAFVSPHCVIDFTNGAATATVDGLGLLAQSDFECQAFCGTRFDAWEEILVEESLARLGLRYEVRNLRIGAQHARLIFTRHGKVAVTLFNTASTRGACSSEEETRAFLAACELFLVKNRPDVLWTYGGDSLCPSLYETAQRLGIPILFALHNFRYRDIEHFRMVDRVIVPTDYARRHYRDEVGLACEVLPLVVDPERVNCHKISNLKSEIPNKSQIQKQENPKPRPHPNPLPEGDGTDCASPLPPPGGGTRLSSAHPTISPQYVTFVNPEPRKGVHVFARIAEVLSRRRPDIPMLLVEGASKASFLPQLGIDLSDVKNLRVMANTPDPRRFHAVTRLLLMPSLIENAALVAMEAMLNGIPVLASNRGGLPETIGDAGYLFDIPARYTPETREVPTAEEVEPWVEAIIRLWDDLAEYERWSQAARDRAQQWSPERLAPLYREFFSSITHQPGPPPTMGTWCPPKELTAHGRVHEA